MAVTLALLAAVVYGAADFFGGLASRKTPAVAVVVLSQLVGLAFLIVAAFFVPGHFYAGDVAWGVAAGIGGAVGIGALYAALAIGRMGVVSPVTAVVGASVPVVVGFALGDRPPLHAAIGLALAFVAVALVAANAESWHFTFDEPGIGLALVSGLAIGALYVFLSRGHHDAGLTLLGTTRVTSIVLLGAYALLRRVPLVPARGAFATIAFAGGLDMLANVFYVLASHAGLLEIVAVLTSLYPASTVILARFVLDERLARSQWAGVAFATAGVVLLAR